MKTHDKIRFLREERAWTQEEMAAKLSMSTQGYAKIERGDTRSNLARLEQISEVFGVDLVELITYGEDAQKNFINSANNSSFSNSNFAVTNGDHSVEIHRLQLILSHKEEIIESLKKENQLLLELNEMLKNK